jgi:transposase
MEAYSPDLRAKVLAAWDAGEGTRPELARRFKVSVRWIDKIRRQRREEGTIQAKKRGTPGKPSFDASARRKLVAQVRRRPDMTLEQLAQWAGDELGIVCTRGAVDNTLKKEGFTFKKRRSRRASNTAPTSRKGGDSGNKR